MSNTQTPHVFHPAALARAFAAAIAIWKADNAGSALDDFPVVVAGSFDDLREEGGVVVVSCEETEANNKHLPASRVWTGTVSVAVEASRDVPLDDAQGAAEAAAQAVAETEEAGTLAEQWETFAPEKLFFAAAGAQRFTVDDGVKVLTTEYAVKLQPAEAEE